MYEAKHEVVRILLKEKKREGLIAQLEKDHDDLPAEDIREYYHIILKMAWRTFN